MRVPLSVQIALCAVTAAVGLAGCNNALSLLAPVNDARAAVKQRLGDDWNITLPIVEKSGTPDAYVCGYTEPPHEAKPGATPPLTDEHLFMYVDHKLILTDDVGTTALGDRMDKECPGFMRVKAVEPRQMIDLPTRNLGDLPR